MKLSETQIEVILFSTMALLFRLGFTEENMYNVFIILARILGVN